MKKLIAICIEDPETIYTQSGDIISIVKVQFDDSDETQTCVVFTGKDAEVAGEKARVFRVISFDVTEDSNILPVVFKSIEWSQLTKDSTITLGCNFSRFQLGAVYPTNVQ